MIIHIPIWCDNINSYLHEIACNRDKITYVVLNCLNDFDYHRMGGDETFTDNCIALCKDYNIPLMLITCYSEKINPVIRQYDFVNEKFVKVEWPLYFIFRTYILMTVQNNHLYNTELNLNIMNDNVNLDTTFDYTYISLNNLAKPHRCQLMDYLARDGLIDEGAIAWRDVVRGIDHERHLIPEGMTDSDFAKVYEYQYWKPKVMLLDQHDTHNIVSQEILPKEYNKCFMQIVPETDTEVFFLSEKTAVPLLFNKPFLVLSNKNFHRTLELFGFQLYTEIFDYTFDDCDSVTDRIEGIVQNVKKISSLNFDEKIKLFDSIIPKLKHNRNMAFKYIFEYIPNELVELAKLPEFGSVKSELYSIRHIKKIEQI